MAINRFWLLAGGIFFLLLISFGIFEALGIASFIDLEAWMPEPTLMVALFGIALLALDVVLPLPSSLIMIANGALFGMVIGTLLSLVGNLFSALVGFFIGRRSSTWGMSRFVPASQMAEANHLLRRWGMLAIVITRPIPLLSETTSIVAGMSDLTVKQLLVATVAGALPAAVLYALTGTIAATFNDAVWGLGLILVITAVFWLLRDPLNRILKSE